MKASALASRALVLGFALLAACSGGTTPDDGSTQGDSSTNDASMDTGTASDAATDGPRVRDTGAEISVDSAFGQCFVTITPRTGTRADTFVINGTAIRSTPTATLRVIPEAGGAPVIDTTVTITSDEFTYMIAPNTLEAGNYRAEVNDPSFVCSTYGPFTVNP